MAKILTLILNPRHLLIAVLSIALAATWVAYDVQKHKAMKCSGTLALCETNVEGFKAEISSANSIIESLKRNLAAIRLQAEEWRLLAAGADELRRRILELQESPRECEVLHEEYRKVAGDITLYFNDGGLRGKIHRPDPAGDRAAPEILPGASAPAAGGAEDDARPSR
jgi:hypothetical protein